MGRWTDLIAYEVPVRKCRNWRGLRESMVGVEKDWGNKTLHVTVSSEVEVHQTSQTAARLSLTYPKQLACLYLLPARDYCCLIGSGLKQRQQQP